MRAWIESKERAGVTSSCEEAKYSPARVADVGIVLGEAYVAKFCSEQFDGCGDERMIGDGATRSFEACFAFGAVELRDRGEAAHGGDGFEGDVGATSEMLCESATQDVLGEGFLGLFRQERIAFEAQGEAIGSDVQKHRVFQDRRKRRTFATNNIEDRAKNTQIFIA